MTCIPPPLPAAYAPAPRALSPAIAAGSAVAIACAFALGLIGGLTNRQFAYGAILLGVFVGQAIRRIRRDTQGATAGALISLAGSALASLIALTMRLVKAAHIPLSVVLAHIPTVISLLPHAIGALGFLCWALATFTGWVNVGGLRPWSVRIHAETAAVDQGRPDSWGQQSDSWGQQPGGSPGRSGSGCAASHDQPLGPGPTQTPGG
jgi:hypothetical protein